MPPLLMTKLRNQITTAWKRRRSDELNISLKNVRINGDPRGCDGFIEHPATGRIVYVNTEQFTRPGLPETLYRTAKDTRDFHGGRNQFADAEELPEAIVDLLLADERHWVDAA